MTDISVSGVPTLSGRPDLLSIAWRRRWRHLFAGLVLSACAVAAASFVQPRYRALAQLLVDPRDIKILDNQLTPATDAQSIGVTLVESQVLVLGSDSVLSRAIDKLGLASDPEFNGRRATFSGRIRSSLGFGETRTDVDARATALHTLQRNVRVRRIDRTYVIDVTATAQSRDKARSIVDAIVTAYINDQIGARADVARRTGQDLDAGINALRNNLAGAERKLAAYKEKNDLVGVRGQFVNEQQLADLNVQLINARVEVARLEARRIGGQVRDLDSVPEVLASPTLRDLRASLSRALQQKAALEAQMLPGHPAVRAAADNERKITSMIATEINRIREGSDIELRRARANAAALEKQLAALRTELNRTNNAQIQLRELEREVEVSRSLYQQALTRTREAAEQSRVNPTNVRIISAANADMERSFPPPTSFLAMFGFGIGALLSMALSFARLFLGGRSALT